MNYKDCLAYAKRAGFTESEHWPPFLEGLERGFDHLEHLLSQLYGHRPDYQAQLKALVSELFTSFVQRPGQLRKRDKALPVESAWFQEGKQIGAVCYVDRFAGTFKGLEARIPYLKELGITYLHLMPFFKVPLPESDGGYAVSSYRETNPDLGTMEDLEHLAQIMADHGIVLVADFIFNHSSDEHPWAMAAKAGDPAKQDFYWFFDHREETIPWQAHLRDIFPEQRRGSFTRNPETGKWVWTTFHSYQWDLNYANPAVFTAMAGEMLSIANRGIAVLRLDAVAFVWKRLGTSCENLPQAHTIIQAFQAVCRIVAPSLVFKSEAIVHPDDIVRYLSPGECQISYNPLLMAELWEASATREVRLLALSLKKRHHLPPGTAWVNYVRCHDDIGWTFADEDAWQLGINGYDHRQFLNRFYTGEFPGSFSKGLSFQYNPHNGDRRICGSAASLAGVEVALSPQGAPKGTKSTDPHENPALETALSRLILLYSLVYSVGGLPLLYLGDELAVLNDYSYQNNPAHAADSRWVHRPRWNQGLAAQRHKPKSPAGKVFLALVKLGTLRASHGIFSIQNITVLDSPHPSVLVFQKQEGPQTLIFIGNFADRSITLDAQSVSRLLGPRHGLSLLDDTPLYSNGPLELKPCQSLLVLQG